MTIVVGGARSGIGKTALVCELIEKLDGVCAVKCSVSDRHTEAHIIVSEGILREKGKDTSLFYEAGATKVIMVRAPREKLGTIAPELERMVTGCRHVIIEGNTIAQYIHHDLIIYIDDEKGDERTKGSVITERMADIKLQAFNYDIQAVLDEIERLKNHT
jgi:molybdopterin-guanine dinucleotide biosynthesis protein